MKKISDSLTPSDKFIKKYADDYWVGVGISTDFKVEQVKILGPSVSKKYKMVDYTIWIPYKQVMESDNILKSYLDILCDNIITVLNKYDFETAAIIKICEEVKQEVIDNPEYAYDPKDD